MGCAPKFQVQDVLMDAKQPPKQNLPLQVDEDIAKTRETDSEQQSATVIGMDE